MPLLLLALALLYVVLGITVVSKRVRTHVGDRAVYAPFVALAASTALMIYYVASEDSYRRNGISRWVAYGNQPAVQALFWIGMVAAAIALAGAALAPVRRGTPRIALLLGLIAVGTQFLASVGFTSN